MFFFPTFKRIRKDLKDLIDSFHAGGEIMGAGLLLIVMPVLVILLAVVVFIRAGKGGDDR